MKATKLWWIAAMVLIVCVAGRAGQSNWTSWPWWGTTAAAPLAVAIDDGDRYERVIAEGRLVTYPGAEVVVGAEMAGRLIAVHVDEKEIIRKGHLLAEIKSDELKASRAEAQSKIKEAEADIRLYQLEVLRMARLRNRGAGSESELDKCRREVEAALAHREAASASCDRYDALIAMTQILSPIDGVVIARYVHPGEMVGIATKLFTVANLDRVRVEAEVDEFDIEKVKIGGVATIRAEGFRDAVWHGIVEEIPDAVVTRRVRPEDPGRPIDSRVLLVKIALDQPTPLKLGQRVEVEIRKVDERTMSRP